jgi:hypothetical protein
MVIALEQYDRDTGPEARLAHSMIGKRVRRKRDAVRRSIRNLKSCGYVIELPTKNGTPFNRYRLTHSVHATGTKATRSNGATGPVVSAPRVAPSTHSNGATHTRQVLDLNTKQVQKNSEERTWERPTFALDYDAFIAQGRRADEQRKMREERRRRGSE